jgi:hypothetical protein
MGMKIIRVFPRKTKASPRDELSYFGSPGLTALCEKDMDEVHVSVSFTYDKSRAEELAEQWRILGVPVKIGGPAYGQITENFIPGMYLREPYVITSVGCPNHCWFCKVPVRVGGLRELEIKDGSIVQDDNLFACSEGHIKAVFEMLGRQPDRPRFLGGLEAKILKPWHVELLHKAKTAEMFFAYDTPDDYEPLIEAGKLLGKAGFTLKSRKAMAYVLIGYKHDTFEKAEKRLHETLKAGFIPFAMLYKDDAGREDETWRKFQRMWSRPAIIVSRNKEYFTEGSG